MPFATQIVDADGDSCMDAVNNAVKVVAAGAGFVVDTELPAAAAMSDTISRTLTTVQVGAMLMVDNGANEVRAPGDVTNGLKVQPAVGGAGAVTAQTPRTTLASDDPAVASLSVMDDWDESDRAKVNPIAGQAGVQGGSGVVTALTQRTCLATDVALPAGTNLLGKTGIDQTTPGTTNAVAPISGQAGVAGGSGVVGATTQRVVLATDVALPAGTNAIGKLAANSGVDIGDVDVTSVAGTVTTKEIRSTTATVTSVADSAASVTVLASNASRLGATVYNDSDQILYLKLGATASTSSFTVVLDKKSANGVGGYYEVPAGYTGILDGIWAADSTGSARITELT